MDLLKRALSSEIDVSRRGSGQTQLSVFAFDCALIGVLLLASCFEWTIRSIMNLCGMFLVDFCWRIGDASLRTTQYSFLVSQTEQRCCRYQLKHYIETYRCTTH
jgi:hypothetical protein